MKRSQKVYIRPSEKKWILGNLIDGLRRCGWPTTKAGYIRGSGSIDDAAQYLVTVTVERVKKKEKAKIGN